MNHPIRKGTIDSESDVLGLGIIDFRRLNGYWPDEGAAMRTIFSFMCDGNATYEVFNVPGFKDAPVRDDFPDWNHVGNHVKVARLFWNWFHFHFPAYELNLSDSPDFQCIKRHGDSSHFIWGDFGQVSASAFALCQKLMKAGDMWMSVLDGGTKHVLITYWSDGADTLNSLFKGIAEPASTGQPAQPFFVSLAVAEKLSAMQTLALKNMKLQFATAVVTLLAITSCSTSRDVDYPPPPSASEVASKLPPLKIPVPVSPVDMRTAVLTLPAEALAEMSLDGRRNYLASTNSEATTAGVFDKVNRRLELICDNPNVGIDAKSMFYLRLFEDEDGRTIAASHSARPFADGSKPSPQFTRVYRLEDRKWHDITDTALSPGIPKNSYFRFDQPGSKVGFGAYVEVNRADGRGKCYSFGKTGTTMQWRSGAFREDRKGEQ